MRKLRTIHKPLNPVQLFFISEDFTGPMIKWISITTPTLIMLWHTF